MTDLKFMNFWVAPVPAERLPMRWMEMLAATFLQVL